MDGVAQRREGGEGDSREAIEQADEHRIGRHREEIVEPFNERCEAIGGADAARHGRGLGEPARSEIDMKS